MALRIVVDVVKRHSTVRQPTTHVYDWTTMRTGPEDGAVFVVQSEEPEHLGAERCQLTALVELVVLALNNDIMQTAFDLSEGTDSPFVESASGRRRKIGGAAQSLTPDGLAYNA